jgi:DUF2934 family protein
MAAGNCSAMDYSAFIEQRQKRISERAHLRWLRRGCPEGTPEIDWFEAEQDYDRAFVAQLELGIPA